MNQRKFKTYKTMFQRFQKLKVHLPGRHTSFFFEIFVLGDSKIFKNQVIYHSLLRENQIFTEWRNEMIQKHILNFDFNFSDVNKNKSNYSPGSTIIDLIIKEKSKNSTTLISDFNEIRILQLEKEVQNLKNLVEMILEKDFLSITEKDKNNEKDFEFDT